MNLAVKSLGGTVARYMGDGILALFGAPKAQEHHAEQAVRAGLAIQERIKEYVDLLRDKRGLPDFKVRVGINSGRVVGGAVGGEQGEYTVIGDAVNMAARFESAAPPGGIPIGESTFQLASGERVFETQAWAPIEVKGSPRPQPVYQVLRALGLPRFRVASQAPLTGRSAEMSALQAGYQRVSSQRKPEIIRVLGPAGIGKSRLRQEFITWLDTQTAPPRVSLGSALTHTGSTPYALVSSLLNESLHIIEADTLEQPREKLETCWKAMGGLSAEQQHGLAALTSVELEDSKMEDLEPQARREVISESFISFWKGQSQQARLVIILEDTHWADTFSLDLVEELVNALPDAPLVLVFFTRPDPHQDARHAKLQAKLGEGSFSEPFLQELDPGDTHKLAQGLLASSDVPPDLIKAITTQVQGNPFFIEEIIHSLLEDGSLSSQNGGWKLIRDLTEIQVPDTVQGVLAACIDLLDPDDKQTLQHAAIIWRSFAQQDLAELLEGEIEETLEKLSERDFILGMGQANLMEDWEWPFHHIRVQEVAYESVLVEVRREIHCQIASYQEATARDRLDELSPTLALHFERGNIWNRAIFYLARAAERSARVFALPEALGLQIATDHGVGFYLLGLQAGLAIDRLHLGDLDIEQELLETYELTCQRSQGMHGLRCLEGLSELALASDELQAALDYSYKMGDIAEAGGMRETAARVRNYRDEAYIALGDFDAAENEIRLALKAANEIKRVRLQWDVHAALEKLYRA